MYIMNSLDSVWKISHGTYPSHAIPSNCVRADPVIMAHPTPSEGVSTYGKQTGTDIQQHTISLLKTFNPSHRNTGFIENVRVAFRKYIPTGCRINYIFGLLEESKSMYEDYKISMQATLLQTLL